MGEFLYDQLFNLLECDVFFVVDLLRNVDLGPALGSLIVGGENFLA